MIQTLLSGVFSIIIVVIIFFLAWFVTRIVASQGNLAGQGKHIEIVEKIAVSKDSYIMLVKIFNKLTVIGVTSQGMTTIKEIDGEELDIEDFTVKKESFAEILKSTIETALPDGKIKSAVDKLLSKKGRKQQ